MKVVQMNGSLSKLLHPERLEMQCNGTKLSVSVRPPHPDLDLDFFEGNLKLHLTDAMEEGPLNDKQPNQPGLSPEALPGQRYLQMCRPEFATFYLLSMP